MKLNNNTIGLSVYCTASILGPLRAVTKGPLLSHLLAFVHSLAAENLQQSTWQASEAFTNFFTKGKIPETYHSLKHKLLIFKTVVEIAM